MSFSLSPRHFETIDEAEMLKKVVCTNEGRVRDRGAQICSREGWEAGLALGSDGLCQHRLARPGWPVQQDAFPRGEKPLEQLRDKPVECITVSMMVPCDTAEPSGAHIDTQSSHPDGQTDGQTDSGRDERRLTLGYLTGITTASFSSRLAPSLDATSSQRTSGLHNFERH